MNKRITSILLCFIMLFSMLVSAVPVYAATYESTQLKVVPDKTTANPGDIITYTIVMGPVSDMGAMQMVLDIPTGLTYVENSGKLADGLKNTLGFDAADWTEASIRTDPLYPGSMINGYASAADYECSTDTVLATFQCKVNDGFTGTVSVGLVKLEFGSCQTFEYHTDRFSVVPTAVTIEAKPVAVTGVTIDETLSVKTGESKTPSYTVNPAEATNKAVSFKSDNPAVATVNETTGEVTGIKEGTATITITTADGNFTDTCVVTVACSHANKTPVAEKASDCKNKGWDAYVKCDDCGQLFKADGTTEISEIPFRELSSNHTGGTATCTAQAVCTVCSQPYGALAAHSYTSDDKKAEALKSEGNCRDFAVYYYSCSACGKVENNDSHTFNGDKDTNTHVGGTHIEGNSEPDHKNQVAGSTGATICDGCGTTLNPATPIAPGAHTPAGVWSTDGTHHWKECSVVGCGVVIDGSKAEHTSTGANVATCTAKAKCSVCGEPHGDLAAHNYTAQTKKPEALKSEGNCRDFAVYYYSCSACGKVENNDSHVFLGEKNANNHVGGTALVNQSEANHKTQTDGYTGDTKCLGCGEIIGRGQPIPAGAHTPANVWSTDGQYHWKECSVVGCGIVINGSKAEHTSTGANVATCQKAAVCDVCGVSYGTVADHDWNTSSWEKDATGHWHKCNTAGCTEKNAFAAHSGGTATCTAKANCSVCGEPHGDLAPHDYTAQTKKPEALKSEGNCRDFAVYYYSCSACGKVENNDSHTFNGDKVPGTHVGGTALVNQSEANHKTQTDGYTGDTKCLGCGEIIGRGQPIPAGAHTPANVWSTDGTHHWKECSVVGCGVVIDGSKAEHTSTGANVATCQKAAVCDVCNVSYGTVADHDWNTTAWEKDATGHWHKCNTAGCTEKNAFAAHTPDHQGGATEEYAIKCTVCQFEIEAQLGHTHVFDKEVVADHYLASKANCTDPAKYYKSCKCGEKGSETFTSGEKLGHTEGTEWKKDETGHWHICTVAGCGVIIDSSKAAHTPDHQGGATEEYAIKCSVCGYEIEAQLQHTHVFDKEVAEEQYLASKANCTDPAKYYKSCKCGEKGTETFISGEKLGHTEGTEWKKDETGHWHICTVAGCGVVIDSSKAAHTPDRDAATETDPIKCSVCGFEIAPALGHTHAHGTDWKSDKDNHWNECACGDKANTAAHKDENTDGKCDVCEYNVGLPTNPDNPQTGDNSMMHLWIILLCVSGLGVIATTVLGKKRLVK